METNVITSIVLPLALFIVMLGMGLSLKWQDFSNVVSAPKAIALGIICQMLLLPIVGVSIAIILNLPGELAVGLVVLALCPGGSTSNLMTYLAKGDVALSVSLTALVSLITPFSVPALTALAITYFMLETNEISFPVLQTMVQLFVIAVLPILIGMIIHNKFPRFSHNAERPVKILSVLLLAVIIIGLVIKNKSDMVGFFVQTGIATLLLNVLTLIAGFCLALIVGLNRKQSISIGMEVGIQNGTMALLVTGTILGNSVMTMPAVTYSLVMFLTGALFSLLVNKMWSNKT